MNPSELNDFLWECKGNRYHVYPSLKCPTQQDLVRETVPVFELESAVHGRLQIKLFRETNKGEAKRIYITLF